MKKMGGKINTIKERKNIQKHLTKNIKKMKIKKINKARKVEN